MAATHPKRDALLALPGRQALDGRAQQLRIHQSARLALTALRGEFGSFLHTATTVRRRRRERRGRHEERRGAASSHRCQLYCRL